MSDGYLILFLLYSVQSDISMNTKREHNQHHATIDLSSVDGDHEYPQSETGDKVIRMQHIRCLVSKTMSVNLVYNQLR